MRIAAVNFACPVSSVYLLAQLSLANVFEKATGFYACIDESGNPGLCSGVIPADLLADEPVTTRPDGRGCGAGVFIWS